MTTLDSAGPLLETKLYVPKLRRGVVARPRLSERLSRGAESKLTLISAPAGFGKTTLLAEWLAAAPAGRRSVAWLSLDQADNQPVTFWTYLITALQTVVPGIGASALSLLQEPQPPPIETVLAPLLNELSAVSNDIVLVLDDYHVVDAPEIQDGMAFLLEHLPPRIHLVIATRADPALPLARLRGRGELVEIRAADLRFTPDEAAAYLNEVMGLDLTAPDVAALEGRTEGWIAALQLAALSMQGRDDIAGFIAGFAGDDRYIVDYLVEEVLQRQPERVRSFLLETSILARMTGPLCDAVTGQDGGKATLEALDRGNLFLVPLDDRRRWYRYHQLFADVLRAHLLDEQPELVPELHRRACEWYEQNGERSEAIRHALAAGDLERAADLVELAIPAMSRGRQEATLRRWLEALPDELLRVRPVLSDAYAGSLLVRGEVEGVEERLRDAERWLDARTTKPPMRAGSMVVVDETAFRRLPGSIAVHRAGQARILGDVAGTMAHARRALDLVGEDDHLSRGGGAALLALAYWTSGDLEAARRSYAAGMARPGEGRSPLGRHRVRARAGRHPARPGSPGRGAARPTSEGWRSRPGRVGTCCGARRTCTSGSAPSSSSGTISRAPGSTCPRPRRWVRRTACRRTATGRASPWPRSGRPRATPTGRSSSSPRPSALYVSDFSPDVRPVAAVKARVWIAQGRLVGGFGLGARVQAVGGRRTQLRPRVRARHARQAAPRGGSTRPIRTRHERGDGAPGRASWQLRTTVSETGASSRSWSCWRSPVRHATTSRVRLRRWSVRSRWPSRRVTSASSSTKASPWWRC